MGKDNLEYEQEEQIPFCTQVNVVGARPGMRSRCSYHLFSFWEVSLSEERRVLGQKYISDIFVKVTENIQFNLCEQELIGNNKSLVLLGFFILPGWSSSRRREMAIGLLLFPWRG